MHRSRCRYFIIIIAFLWWLFTLSLNVWHGLWCLSFTNNVKVAIAYFSMSIIYDMRHTYNINWMESPLMAALLTGCFFANFPSVTLNFPGVKPIRNTGNILILAAHFRHHHRLLEQLSVADMHMARDFGGWRPAWASGVLVMESLLQNVHFQALEESSAPYLALFSLLALCACWKFITRCHGKAWML